MSSVSVPTGDSFVVINANTVTYNGTTYTGVTDIQYPDGTHKTCQQIIDEAGGTAFSTNELKACVKVQGINPDDNNREIFSLYSNNSHQTVKNNSAGVPGNQMSVEMFNFLGDQTTNYIVKMWTDFFYPGNPTPPQPPFNSFWIGFRINYGITETRAYTYTQVNSMSEESAPCPPALVDVTYMHGVTVSGVFRQPAPYGTDFYLPIGELRLYRSEATSDGSFVFRYVSVTAHSSTIGDPFPKTTAFIFSFWLYTFPYTFNDDVRNEDLSTVVLPSTDWDPPPIGLKGIQLLPNGSLAAFKGNNVYLSEPFRPHAWPAKYIQTVGFEVTALEQDGMGLIALTTGFAYMLLGAHPAVVVPTRLDQTQAAKKAGLLHDIQGPSHSVCKTPHGIVYACDEGLMREYGGQTQMITEKLFTKKEWQERFKYSFGMLWLAYSNGKILAYLTGGDINTGFLMAEDGSWMTEFRPDEIIFTHTTLPGSDGIYAITGPAHGTTSNLRKFETFNENAIGGGTMACTWESKSLVLAKPYTFGCYQIVGGGDVTVSIIAGAEFVLTEDVFLEDHVSQIRRLPQAIERSRLWKILLQLSEGAYVSEFYLANTQLELAST